MTQSLILDTNLAVLLIVGMTEKRLVGVHKRTRAYDPRAYELLDEYVAAADEVIFTPNVLTETSNLVRQVNDPLKTRLSLLFAALVARTTELMVKSGDAVGHQHHNWLGLTDAGLIQLLASRADTTILTDDLDLYLAASHAGLSVINFTHVREGAV